MLWDIVVFTQYFLLLPPHMYVLNSSMFQFIIKIASTKNEAALFEPAAAGRDVKYKSCK